MKRSIYSGMRVVLTTAAAAVLASITLTGCMSSGDSTDAGAAVEAPAENGENAANEASANDASNVSGVENGEQTAENAAGGELQNLVNEGSANAAATPAEGAAANSESAGNDPFAAALNNTSAPAEDASAAEAPTNAANAADPFANNAMAAAPAPEAPLNAAADPFAPPTDAAPMEASAASMAEAPVASEPAPVNAAAASVAAPENAIPPAPDASASVASAAALPEGGVLPEMGSKMPYYIKKGDTLAKIAAMIYGDASKWNSLAEENNIKNPSLIYAGDVILYTLSEKSQSFASKYEAAPRSSVKVSRGDTLSSLAKKVFGSQGEWRSLWKMNPQVKNPDVIKEGMVLVYREVSKVAANDDEEEVLVGMN